MNIKAEEVELVAVPPCEYGASHRYRAQTPIRETFEEAETDRDRIRRALLLLAREEGQHGV